SNRSQTARTGRLRPPALQSCAPSGCLLREVGAATPIKDLACQDKARGSICLDRGFLWGRFTQPVRNGAQGRRVSLDDRRGRFVRQWCKWPIGERHQLRLAKADHRRLVEAREHFREGATVLRSSSGQKLPDSRSVPERCLFRSFSILVDRLLQLAAGLREQPQPAFVIGDGRNQRLCCKQERRCRDKK